MRIFCQWRTLLWRAQILKIRCHISIQEWNCMAAILPGFNLKPVVIGFYGEKGLCCLYNPIFLLMPQYFFQSNECKTTVSTLNEQKTTQILLYLYDYSYNYYYYDYVISELCIFNLFFTFFYICVYILKFWLNFICRKCLWYF